MASDTALHSRVGVVQEYRKVERYGGEARSIVQQNSFVADYLAEKYVGKLVYVLTGHRKGRLGRAIDIGGRDARVQLSGAAMGASIETISRRKLLGW